MQDTGDLQEAVEMVLESVSRVIAHMLPNQGQPIVLGLTRDLMDLRASYLTYLYVRDHDG